MASVAIFFAGWFVISLIVAGIVCAAINYTKQFDGSFDDE